MCFNYLGEWNKTRSSLHNNFAFHGRFNLQIKNFLGRSRISHPDIICYFMEHAIHKCTYHTLDVTHTLGQVWAKFYTQILHQFVISSLPKSQQTLPFKS
jgi:hypothetical protein